MQGKLNDAVIADLRKLGASDSTIAALQDAACIDASSIDRYARDMIDASASDQAIIKSNDLLALLADIAQMQRDCYQ